MGRERQTVKRINVVRSAVALGVVLSAGGPPGARAETESPDLGGRIVFSRFGPEFSPSEPMFIANADGTDERLIIDDPGICCPWVADDGSRMAVESFPDSGAEIELIDLDDLSTQPLEPPGETMFFFVGPFTPDGQQMAVGGFDDTDPSRNGIYLVTIDDPSDAVQITHEDDPLDIEGTAFPMDFSPDGSQLVLYQQADGDGSNTHGSVAVVNADGTGLHTVTPVGVDLPCCVRWSPDGSKILFADLDGRMLTINPDGSELIEVFSQEGSWVRQPNWSPDGTQIVFTLNPTADPNAPEPNELYVVNADGTGLTLVVGTEDPKCCSFWVPDADE